MDGNYKDMTIKDKKCECIMVGLFNIIICVLYIAELSVFEAIYIIVNR